MMQAYSMERRLLTRPPLFCSCRLVLSVVSCLGFASMYSLRFNVVGAISCLARDKEENIHSVDGIRESGGHPPHCMELSHSASSANESYSGQLQYVYGGTFDWGKSTQAEVTGSFFWSYWITQIPGGWLAERHGGKRLFALATVANGVMTLLIPLAVKSDYRAVICIRLLLGLFQGVQWPAMFVILSRWAPPLERQKLVTLCLSGSTFGIVLTFPAVGILCDSAKEGWTYAFYLTGGLAIIWCLLWQYFVYDSPDQHPRITGVEKAYIRSSLRDIFPEEETHETPWNDILSSPAVFAMILSHACANFSLYALMSYLPTYLHDVHYISKPEAARVSAIPYIGFFAACNISASVYDTVVAKKICSRTFARKTGNTIGLLIPAILLIVVGFMSCAYSSLALLTLIVINTVTGVQYGAGFLTNVPEIAPQHSGVIFGISNTFATFAGMLSLTVTKELTEHRLRSGWQITFLIISALFVLASIMFIIYGSGELQKWAKGSGDKADIVVTSAVTSLNESTKDNSANSGAL